MNGASRIVAGWCVVALSAAFAASSAPPAAPAPPQRPVERSAVGTLNEAIRLLRQEAREALERGGPARSKADFAAAFLAEPAHERIFDRALVWKRLREPLDRDPFVDAYIRWQLTGFEPSLPPPDDHAGRGGGRDQEAPYEDEEFLAFLASLPRMVPNPRSDGAVLARLNQTLARETVSEREAEVLNAMNAELEAATARAAALNQPAMLLREWIIDQLREPKRGDPVDEPCPTARRHLALLERIGAMVAAGWNVEEGKREFARAIEASARDASFTPAQRRTVAEAARSLAGRRAGYVTRVGATEGVPEAEFDEAAVYDFEVTAWVRTLGLNDR